LCGRFLLVSSSKELAEQFELDETPEIRPRYNLAPSQEIAAIRLHHGPQANKRELIFLTWGLIPSWSKDPAISQRLINARCETVESKPAFRSSFKKRRILIPANGFYEWKGTQSGARQPYLISLEKFGLLAFAGIYDEWKSPSGDVTRSCAIITTQSNDLIKSVHDRMPVVVPTKDYGLWLESADTASEDFRNLLRPLSDDNFRITQVGMKVNRPDYDKPDCIEALKTADGEANQSVQGSLYLKT
jgi:putative SOS response-associated peptidase YedK